MPLIRRIFEASNGYRRVAALLGDAGREVNDTGLFHFLVFFWLRHSSLQKTHAGPIQGAP